MIIGAGGLGLWAIQMAKKLLPVETEVIVADIAVSSINLLISFDFRNIQMMTNYRTNLLCYKDYITSVCQDSLLSHTLTQSLIIINKQSIKVSLFHEVARIFYFVVLRS